MKVQILAPEKMNFVVKIIIQSHKMRKQKICKLKLLKKKSKQGKMQQ